MIKNESGVTLAEVVVALGISALLLVFVVTGGLFIKKYIRDWSDRDKIWEELSFIRKEFAIQVSFSRWIEILPDSVIFAKPGGNVTSYRVDSGRLLKTGVPISSSELRLDSLRLAGLTLPKGSSHAILQLGDKPTGLYELLVVVSDHRGNTDTLKTVLRNDHEYLKYGQK